jgi:ParB family chromosome partitioning protein
LATGLDKIMQKYPELRELVKIWPVPPGTMWFACEVKRLHDSGLTLMQISNITGKCETYIRDYIRLVEQGEERLIKGVEDGIFPISFAKHVAKSNSANIQNVLMDAYDKGIVK